MFKLLNIYWKEKETRIHFGCYLYQIFKDAFFV